MRNPIAETMSQLRVRNFKVRVWCSAEEDDFGPDDNVSLKLAKLDQEATTGNHIFLADDSLIELIKTNLQSVPNVAAYEILNEHGDGIVIYPDWP